MLVVGVVVVVLAVVVVVGLIAVIVDAAVVVAGGVVLVAVVAFLSVLLLLSSLSSLSLPSWLWTREADCVVGADIHSTIHLPVKLDAPYLCQHYVQMRLHFNL